MLEVLLADSIWIKGTDGREILLRVSSEQDADHILYKPRTGGRRRNRELSRHPDDFKRDRAERIRFIPETLKDPDEIRQNLAHPQRRMYVSYVSETELFIVVVEKPQKSCSYLVSAYPVFLLEEWQRMNWQGRLDESETLYKKKGRS